MHKFRVTGIPPYDGEYEIDFGYYLNDELRTIKRMSGVRGNEIREALTAGDNDLITALTVIAVQRSGKFPIVVEDAFWKARADQTEFIEDEEMTKAQAAEEAADAGDPPIPAEPLDAGESGSSPSESSGTSSETLSESQENDPSPTGTQA